MGKPVLPDTDVLIDFLRGHAKALALVRSCEDRLILSAVVVSELYAGGMNSSRFSECFR
ncbi:MAG: hypothetical protein LBD06_07470 [Candidatus Accumulibacter sp.]|nr:hypothetical protein [Accumulibacter sp.]